jgi:hypothetical protein
MAEWPMALSFVQPITLSLSLLQSMASNNDSGGDDDSSDSSESPEEDEEEVAEEEEEVSSEETSMNQPDTSEEKLFSRCAHGMLFGNDGDIPSTSLKPRTPESRRRFDEESSDDDDDFYM